MMNIFEQLRSGADVDMATPEYAEAIKHMTDEAMQEVQQVFNLPKKRKTKL